MRSIPLLLFVIALGACSDPATLPTTAGDSTGSTGTTDPGTSTGSATGGSSETSTTDPTTATTATASSTSGLMPTSSGPTTLDTTTTTDSTTTTTGTTDSTTTTTGTTADSSSSTTGDPVCDQYIVEPHAPHVMLVIDKSTSMLNGWDHDGDPNTEQTTRWYSLHAVLDQTLGQFQGGLDLGMNLFPSKAAILSYSAAACPVNADVEVPVAAANKAAIMAVLPGPLDNKVIGATPTVAGMTAALNHLKTLDPAVPRAVVLVTDGAANCSADAVDNPGLMEVYDDDIAAVIGDAFTLDQIPTHVVGIAIADVVTPVDVDAIPDNINLFQKLGELAELGGTAEPGPDKFRKADNEPQLVAAIAESLTAIAQDAQSCTVPLDNPPMFPDLVEVSLGGVGLAKLDDCAQGDGWAYTAADPPFDAITMCGTACEGLLELGQAEVTYLCP